MRSSGTSLALLLLVSTTLADMHIAHFSKVVKLTTGKDAPDQTCRCSFSMVSDKDEVEVEKSKVTCTELDGTEGCSGEAEDVELGEENDCKFYIVDAFTVSSGEGTITGASVEFKPCKQNTKCKGAFDFHETGMNGLCSRKGGNLEDWLGLPEEDQECLPDGLYMDSCDCPGCVCCKECTKSKECSDKGEGYSCYSADVLLSDVAADLQLSCAEDSDHSCAGSSHDHCVCCKNMTSTTTSAPITTTKTTIETCDTTRGCESAYPGMGLRGFCGDTSLLGGDCASSDQPGGKHLCQGESCTCCKECLDMKCSEKGKNWSCHNKKSADALPKGSCVFDRSCSSAPGSPYEDSTCACCKTDPYPCEDTGCSNEWKGMGACVNVSSADWADLDYNFNLSIPGIPGKCGPEGPECNCVCLKKKQPCADEGCSSFFNGAGVCLNALDPAFAEMSPFLDFTAGGREDLCAGCCSCFKKRCVDTVHGSVAFAVDTTGSMQKSLPLVKATIKELVDSGSDVPKWILTSFNDPSATVVTETHISADLITAAELLSFGGGGDTKEQALKGIDITLDTMPDNGVILVFTDTGSHQLELQNAVKEKSESKNVKILFVILSTPGVLDTASLEVYDNLSNGQIFYGSADESDLDDMVKFFEAVKNTVQNPCDELH